MRNKLVAEKKELLAEIEFLEMRIDKSLDDWKRLDNYKRMDVYKNYLTYLGRIENLLLSSDTNERINILHNEMAKVKGIIYFYGKDHDINKYATEYYNRCDKMAKEIHEKKSHTPE